MSKNWLFVLLAIITLGMVPSISDAQAVVIKDTSCTVLDLDPTHTFEILNTIKVTTPSRNCNRSVSCHGDLSDGSLFVAPDKAVTLNYENTGSECWVNFDGEWVSTTSWHQVITPSGNISLTCHFNGCDAGPPPV